MKFKIVEGLKVFLDDIRTPPTGWILTKTPEETIKLLKTGKVTDLSLDHDLGENVGNGYDVILWIEEEVYTFNFIPPNIKVHSSNVSAREKMEAGINKIYELTEKVKKEVKSEFTDKKAEKLRKKYFFKGIPYGIDKPHV